MSDYDDYAHCKGDGCLVKGKCMRYQLHLDYLERRRKGQVWDRVTYTWAPLYDDLKGCELFKEA